MDPRTPSRSPHHRSKIYTPPLDCSPLTINRSQIFEEKRKEYEGGEQCNQQRPDRCFISRLTGISLSSLHSLTQDATSTRGDHRAQFYKAYRKVAEEYDKEFLKNHDEDLSTTLIFVSSARTFNGLVLTEHTGRFVLCGDFCIHHRGQLPAST